MPGIALSAEEREEICIGLVRGESFRAIGRRLGRHGSTISREVNRNVALSGVYNAVFAQRQTDLRRKRPKQRVLHRDHGLYRRVHRELSNGYSPVAIARRTGQVCAETIYQAVYSRVFDGLAPSQCLRTRRHRRRRRGQRRSNPSSWRKQALSITQRPGHVEERVEPGHWEGDLIIGRHHGSAVVTMIERSSRKLRLLALPSGAGAPGVTRAIIAMFNRVPARMKRTLTWDGGNEIAQYARIRKATGIEIYICDPSSPWQRGSNENANRLVRFWLQKGTDLSRYTQEDLNRIATIINNHPRRIHQWKTANEVYHQLLMH